MRLRPVSVARSGIACRFALGRPRSSISQRRGGARRPFAGRIALRRVVARSGVFDFVDKRRKPSRSTERSVVSVDGMQVSVVRRAGQKRAYLRVKAPDGRIEVSRRRCAWALRHSRLVREHAFLNRAAPPKSRGRPRRGRARAHARSSSNERAVVAACTRALIEKWAPCHGPFRPAG